MRRASKARDGGIPLSMGKKRNEVGARRSNAKGFARRCTRGTSKRNSSSQKTNIGKIMVFSDP
jgi:hypothetical protein